jgi:hypothetical protein
MCMYICIICGCIYTNNFITGYSKVQWVGGRIKRFKNDFCIVLNKDNSLCNTYVQLKFNYTMFTFTKISHGN